MGSSWRERPLAEALAAGRKARSFAGISRLARVDGLSGIDIPVHCAFRPSSAIEVTVNAGKGTTADESRLSALFEAIEIAAAEVDLPHRLATVVELDAERAMFVPPERLGTLPSGDRLAWSEVVDYETGARVLCPTVAVNMLPTPGPFLPQTNGLASGMTFSEAIFHGLLEVLERHAYSFALVQCSAITVDWETLEDAFLRDVATKIEREGLRLEIKDVSARIGVPCYYAVLFAPGERDSHLVAGGLGCHLDARIAVRRAVAEALQSRAVVIAGSREDITHEERRRDEEFDASYELYRFWYEPTPERTTVPILESLPASLEEAITLTLARARAGDANLGRMLFHRFEATAGIHVVRTILEGAEVFCLERDRLSPVLAKYFEGI